MIGKRIAQGVILGVLYCITLLASLNAFGEASFILYGNIYQIPVWSTVLISSFGYVLLVTSDWWQGFALYVLFDGIDE